MKKLNILVLISLFCVIFVYSISAKMTDGFTEDYFPLSVGNKFFYSVNGQYLIGITVTKDTTILQRKYYYVQGGIYDNWYRVDSISGSLYAYDAGNICQNVYYYEKIRDSLRANVNDYTSNCTVGYPNTCTFISTRIVFGQEVNVKNFYVPVWQNNYLQSHSRIYSDRFGLIYYENRTSGPPPIVGTLTARTIIGCIIDSVFYGDSILTSIDHNADYIPDSFSLYQNYPNPFNPETVISYELQVTGFIKLTVFDIQGREIKTLVNQKQDAGIYEIDFDGSGFMSGIFFYRIEMIVDKSGKSFSDTKKMMIIR